jgi:hypothetical protein
VRGVLVSLSELGDNSKPVFDAMMRAIDERPHLIDTMYKGLQTVQIKGSVTGAFSVDLARFDRAIAAIASALYFRHFGAKKRHWEIFSPEFYLAEAITQKSDPYDPLRRAVMELKYVWAESPSPKVFCYGRAGGKPSNSLWQFLFYDAFICFAWPKRQPF